MWWLSVRLYPGTFGCNFTQPNNYYSGLKMSRYSVVINPVSLLSVLLGQFVQLRICPVDLFFDVGHHKLVDFQKTSFLFPWQLIGENAQNSEQTELSSFLSPGNYAASDSKSVITLGYHKIKTQKKMWEPDIKIGTDHVFCLFLKFSL